MQIWVRRVDVDRQEKMKSEGVQRGSSPSRERLRSRTLDVMGIGRCDIVYKWVFTQR